MSDTTASVTIVLPDQGQGPLIYAVVHLQKLVPVWEPEFSGGLGLGREVNASAIQDSDAPPIVGKTVQNGAVSIRNTGWGRATNWNFCLEGPVISDVFPVEARSMIASVDSGDFLTLEVPMAAADQGRLAALIRPKAEAALAALDESWDDQLNAHLANLRKNHARQSNNINAVRWRNHLKMTALGHDWPYEPLPIPPFDEDEAITDFFAKNRSARHEHSRGLRLRGLSMVASAADGTTRQAFSVDCSDQVEIQLTPTGFTLRERAWITYRHPPQPTALIDLAEGLAGYGIPCDPQAAGLLGGLSCRETRIGETRCYGIPVSALQSCDVEFDVSLFFATGEIERAGPFVRKFRTRRGQYATRAVGDRSWRVSLRRLAPGVNWKSDF